MKFERTKKEARVRKKFEPLKEKYEREEKAQREKEKEDKQKEWELKRDEYQREQTIKELKYLQRVYGANMKNLKLSKKNPDQWEIYKAREYVKKENNNGHECYNAVEGRKLWINREKWKMMHNR